MALIIDTSIDVNEDVPTFATGPAGSTLIRAFAYPEYFQLQPDEELTTYQVDFATVEALGSSPFDSVFAGLTSQILANGQLPLAYFVYENPTFEISIPDQFCLGDLCWTPPFAGQSVISSMQYRVWIVAKDLVYGPSPLAVRGFLPVALAIVIVAALIVLLPQIVGLIGVLTGKVPYSQLKSPEISPLQNTLKAPGENVATAEAGLALPLLFLGAGMAGLAVLITRMNAQSVSVSQPTPGGGRVTVAGSSKGK